MGPRSAKIGQDGAKVRQDGPRWGQDEAKMAPRWSQDGPKWGLYWQLFAYVVRELHFLKNGVSPRREHHFGAPDETKMCQDEAQMEPI